ncbi:hypothetical protein IQ243_14975 [Nostocales cyanobacterium LEGE 11386]|nr:hypothetical protein [Nostocales cyanobacterium LEGE 11386]
MSLNRQLVKTITKIAKQFSRISRNCLSAINNKIIWILRSLFVSKRRRSSANAGFVLPTVAMVSIVVVLLTTAILFRSFERSKNASNVRVNETVLNAATPAIDRARAKINKLFLDGRLPRATPTDDALYGTLTSSINEYTFGDETQLKLKEGTEPELETAWQYPVDTDNNGKFDSYTLYGIYFKNPPVVGGAYTRARNSLEARTPPMNAGSVSGDCGDTFGTSATLVGSTGWFNLGGKLKKSFFVYTATVPITQNIPTPTDKYERYKGNKGFSAIEYQQDRVQLPVVNNAVVYEDDIALAPGTPFNLNGRIFTNSNFITGGVSNTAVRLYQVSSKDSCFYSDDNAKIIVGGNLGAGGFTDNSDLNSSTLVHLYQGKGTNPTTTGTATSIKDNKSVTEGPANIAYNSLAYVERINRLVDAQMANAATSDPQEVQDGIQQQKDKLGLPSYTAEENERFRRQELQTYFRRRTRRVPYTEVGFGGDALGNYAVGGSLAGEVLQGSGNTLRPPDVWMYPTNPSDGKTGTNYTNLTLNPNGTDKLLPAATEPNKLQKDLGGKEQTLGDRVMVGNNLPELWWNGSSFVGPNQQDTQNIAGIEWDDGDGTRTRRSRIEALADLGATDRDKDWELAAAKIPTNPQDPVGGLRVVTGSGIYLPDSLTTTATDVAFASAPQEIWSDMMPVASKTAATATGGIDPEIQLPANMPYLRMRATAVYHYNIASYDEKAPAPIACVSSYYDPTSSVRAKNLDLPTIPYDKAPGGASNNGVVYAAPNTATGETTYANVLNYQAQLKYPNGRLVNEPLKQALAKTAANRTLSERSAVESALCALQILDGTISVQTTPVVPHGAIKEIAFLDARQVKAIHLDEGTLGVETFTNADGNGTISASVPPEANYNLPKEQRQPLEIRATVLDINQLRGKSISGGVSAATEYLLPNSGIIYATRDDALLDLSAPKPSTGSNTQKEEIQKTESPVDFKLDPTRRPNAIMLTNGSEIGRTDTYRDVERGLILASNLPVYIKGDFNVHTQEEFTTALADTWSNFYSRAAAQRNPNFACRKNDPRLPNCTVGDKWRPASVLTDAITLLSNNFREGFRNEGEYDLNNNLGNQDSIDKFQEKGFFSNAYVINAEWFDSNGTPRDIDADPGFQGSSYLNNFVTPIQRRVTFNEYLMELCPKLPVSACEPDDWYVNPSSNEHSWDIGGGIVGKAADTLESGTTATFAATAYQRYPRRVAYKRNSSGNLFLDANVNKRPTPLGINSSGNVAEFPYGASANPRQTANTLWFRTTTRTNPKQDNNVNADPVDTKLLLANEDLSETKESQPRPLPVLQITRPFGTPETAINVNVGPPNSQTPNPNWLQPATETEFNLVAAAGDTPARPTEDNGGLHNFVRFMENWNPTGNVADARKAKISGSFIQFKRSAYATGPFRAFLSGSSELYPIAGNQGRAPFYLAPTRQWGYDVGLLSQSPDLFAQKLVRIPDDLPDEFFREVGRDDKWVETLLCAKKADNTYAIDADQRPCT